MILRPRQTQFVDRALAALAEHGNTLGVAPTGAGKTVMASAIASSYNGKRVLFLQGRDRLLSQNMQTMLAYNGKIPLSIVDSRRKEWHGQVVFGMVQTVVKQLNFMPQFDLLIRDECHGQASPTDQMILSRAREINPGIHLMGLTATPERSDGKPLRAIYDNVADIITYGELIRSGHLVVPKAKAINVGTRDELMSLSPRGGDYDAAEVADIMNKVPVNNAVFEHWMEHCGDRRTIAFCSTVEHAIDLSKTFNERGAPAAWISGSQYMTRKKAEDILDEYKAGKYKVLFNVQKAVEGFDDQPTSAVLLLRMCSHASVVRQMIGRGLRRVDPDIHPDIIKHDCIVLDFGTSLLTNPGLFSDVADHLGEEKKKKVATCPACLVKLPPNSDACPVCGWALEKPEPEEAKEREEKDIDFIEDFRMIDVKIMEDSPFRWESLFNEQCLMACSFSVWACCVKYKDNWYAVSGGKGRPTSLLMAGEEKAAALSVADDYMRKHAKASESGTTKRWLLAPITDKQADLLKRRGANVRPGMSRYLAMCFLEFIFNQNRIKDRVKSAAESLG